MAETPRKARRLHVMAACSDRKTLPVPPALRFRDVPPGSTDRRVAEWWRRLRSHRGVVTPAVDVYAGNHWAIVRSLPEAARERGLDATLRVLSAGYGLINADTRILGYSATFAFGHEDSVASTDQELALWWSALAALRPAGNSGPRSLANLVVEDPGATVLIVGSPSYVAAIEGDLGEALQRDPRANLLIVSGLAVLKRKVLAPHCIPCGAPLQRLVGGPLAALYARVARDIIREAGSHEFELAALRARYDDFSRRCAEGSTAVRRRQGDDEVRGYIRAALRAAGEASYTALLRRMRAEGLACEASRFKSLYEDESRRSIDVA